MSSPEIQRRVRQHGADIDSLYELTTAMDQKIDALDGKVESLDGKVESLSTRVDTGFARMDATLTSILQRLEAR
jgi:flagellar capping protein FliD